MQNARHEHVNIDLRTRDFRATQVLTARASAQEKSFDSAFGIAMGLVRSAAEGKLSTDKEELKKVAQLSLEADARSLRDASAT